jgi:hypothetical protein
VLPFYAYLAAAGAFLENHCSGFGTSSTPNHLLIVGGQSPTLRNPPRNAPQPVRDMPSLPGHAADHGLTWKACRPGRRHRDRSRAARLPDDDHPADPAAAHTPTAATAPTTGGHLGTGGPGPAPRREHPAPAR